MAITVRLLKQLAAPFADDLVARGVAEPRLAAIRPGGEDNPQRDSHAWLRYYGRLCALRASVERESPSSGSIEEATADRVIMDALAGTPAHVTIGGVPYAGLVAYPKSPMALLTVHVRDLVIKRLLAGVRDIGASDDPETMTLVGDALTEVIHQHRVIAWIACTEGDGLPFQELAIDPELPEQFRDLPGHVLVEVCRAFDTVNWARLRFLEALISPDPERDEPRRRPSWSQFFGSLAADEKHGSEHVMRNGTLVGRMATMQLAASAQREAMAAAKEKAAQRGDD